MILKALGIGMVFAALAVPFAGCQTVEEATSGTTAALNSEAQRYALLTQALSRQGEDSTLSLKDWAGALAEINGRLSVITAKLAKKPGDRGKVENRLGDLRDKLDKLFGRPATLTLAYVPSWMMTQAVEQSRRAKETFADMRDNYRALFGSYPAVESLTIELKVDEQILDTVEDCKRAISTNLFLRSNDPTCASYMQDVCGHQMDLACVNRLLIITLGKSCEEQVITGNQQTEKRAAVWITQDLKVGCVSRTLVLRPAK